MEAELGRFFLSNYQGAAPQYRFSSLEGNAAASSVILVTSTPELNVQGPRSADVCGLAAAASCDNPGVLWRLTPPPQPSPLVSVGAALVGGPPPLVRIELEGGWTYDTLPQELKAAPGEDLTLSSCKRYRSSSDDRFEDDSEQLLPLRSVRMHCTESGGDCDDAVRRWSMDRVADDIDGAPSSDDDVLPTEGSDSNKVLGAEVTVVKENSTEDSLRASRGGRLCVDTMAAEEAFALTLPTLSAPQAGGHSSCSKSAAFSGCLKRARLPVEKAEAMIASRLEAFFQDDAQWQRIMAVVECVQKQYPPTSIKSMTLVQFRVDVPRPYPGVQYRRSKNLEDKHERYARHGAIVTGVLEEGGTWLKINDSSFLPTKIGAMQILDPVKGDAPTIQDGSSTLSSFQRIGPRPVTAPTSISVPTAPPVTPVAVSAGARKGSDIERVEALRNLDIEQICSDSINPFSDTPPRSPEVSPAWQRGARVVPFG